jgi:hypothetical protein
MSSGWLHHQLKTNSKDVICCFWFCFVQVLIGSDDEYDYFGDSDLESVADCERDISSIT